MKKGKGKEKDTHAHTYQRERSALFVLPAFNNVYDTYCYIVSSVISEQVVVIQNAFLLVNNCGSLLFEGATNFTDVKPDRGQAPVMELSALVGYGTLQILQN